MDLSIIIVNWNTKDLLKDCLRSIYKTINLKYEIFVVDNNSRDESVIMIKNEFPLVRLIENKNNLGFAVANNQAIKLSIGRYIILLNSDTVVLPHAIEIMVNFLESHNDAGACGANLLTYDYQPNICYGFIPTILSQLRNDFLLNNILPIMFDTPKIPTSVGPQINTPFLVEYVSGASLMMRRQVIENIGLIDENLFFYCEDVDFCTRVTYAGWNVYCIPEAKVIHYGGQSSSKEANRFEVEFYKSRYKFFVKQYGLLNANLWRFITGFLMLSSLLKASLAWILRIRNSSKRLLHKNNFILYLNLCEFLFFGLYLKK